MLLFNLSTSLVVWKKTRYYVNTTVQFWPVFVTKSSPSLSALVALVSSGQRETWTVTLLTHVYGIQNNKPIILVILLLQTLTENVINQTTIFIPCNLFIKIRWHLSEHKVWKHQLKREKFKSNMLWIWWMHSCIDTEIFFFQIYMFILCVCADLSGILRTSY